MGTDKGTGGSTVSVSLRKCYDILTMATASSEPAVQRAIELLSEHLRREGVLRSQ
jgi:hypothetical protein